MDTYGGLFQGIDGLKKGYAAAFRAFPDLKAIVNQMIAEEDKVVLHKTVMGTHRGEFRGISATGKKVKYQSIYIFRIENNKISEYWGLQDELKLKQQLGVFAEDNTAMKPALRKLSPKRFELWEHALTISGALPSQCGTCKPKPATPLTTAQKAKQLAGQKTMAPKIKKAQDNINALQAKAAK